MLKWSRSARLIYILYGVDDYSLHEALANIKKGLGDPDTLATNTTLLEGNRLTMAELQAAVEAYPFFGDRRLVIVDGLLDRCEGKAKYGPPRPTKIQEADAATFAAVLKSAPPTTIAVLVGANITNTNPLLNELGGKAKVKAFPPLPLERLLAWIKNRAGATGGTISDDAAAKLADLVGANLWTMSSELDKLSLLTEERRIEVADVEASVAASREVSIFELVDIVMGDKSAHAQRLLQDLLRDGQPPSFILFMLGRQLRLIVRAKSMLAEGRAEPFIAGKLGLQGYPLRKTLAQATHFTMPRLSGFYHRLLEADMAIKTGRYNEDLAISLLVAEAGTQ